MALAPTDDVALKVDLSTIPKPCEQFEIGEVIEIFGLKGKPQWNGKHAIITGDFDESKLRWPIAILDNEGNNTNEIGLLRAINLKLLESCFEIVNIKGKGKGWIATRDIKLGSLIFSERPLFTLPMTAMKNADINLINETINNLPQNKQDIFFSLCNRKDPFGDNSIDSNDNTKNDNTKHDTTATTKNDEKNENETENTNETSKKKETEEDKEKTENEIKKDENKTENTEKNEKNDKNETSEKTKEENTKDKNENKKGKNTLSDTFDLLLTNAISMVSIEHFGIFKTLSRINHSCLPNVRWIYIPQLKSEILIACRPIKKGDEMCVSYMDFGTNQLYKHDFRASSLLKRYNFTCQCNEFCANKELINKTDKLIEDYNRMYSQIGEIIKQSSHIRTANVIQGIELAEECIKICINEWDFYSVRLFGALFECALLYRLIDKWVIASKYLKECIITFWYDRGIDGLYDKPGEINKEILKVCAMGGKICKNNLEKYIIYENKAIKDNTNKKKAAKANKGKKKIEKRKCIRVTQSKDWYAC